MDEGDNLVPVATTNEDADREQATLQPSAASKSEEKEGDKNLYPPLQSLFS